MKKQTKSKIGFTLIEMVLVISIIMILAGIFTLAISRFISLGSAARQSVNSQHESMSSYAGSANSQFQAAGF